MEGIYLGITLGTSKQTISADSIDGLNLARIEVLLKQNSSAIISNLAISLLIFIGLWSEIYFPYLAIFAGYQIVVAFGRWKALKWVQAALSKKSNLKSSKQLIQYERIFAKGSLAAGLGLGLGGFGALLTPQLSPLAQFMIPFVLAGLASGAIAVNVTSLMNYYAFTIPALLLSISGLISLSLFVPAFMVLLYLMLMLTLMKHINSIFMESLKLKEHNAGLVDNLTVHNQELENILVKLNNSERLSSSAFNKAGVTMMLVDKSLQIFKVNREGCSLLGYAELELTSFNLLNLSHALDKESNQASFLDLVAGNEQQYQSRKRYVRRNHTEIWVQETVSAVMDEQGEFDYAIVHPQDITQEYKLTQKLSYQANHDLVTGLNNRFSFENRMQELFTKEGDETGADSYKTHHILCYIDLDQFKVVNDTFGHSVGDTLLHQLSDILQSHSRQSDLLCRIGGDEFALLMFDCSLDAAEKQLNLALARLREFNFESDGLIINTTASVGMVSFNSASNMTEVLKRADSACYVAKEAGRDRLHIYDQEDEFISQRTGEMSWVSRIQRALTEKKFMLYSQEIVSVSETDALPHYELLIRLQGENGDVISPACFLPAAEHYNLAAAIDLWVVEEALTKLSLARDRGDDIKGVYGINLSGLSLGDKRFYDNIIEKVRQHDFREQDAHICFEITETAAILNINSALFFINELRAVGCLFALDDFGSGLSSYAYLQQMPVDFLKIDGMFVKECLNDPVKLEMISSINRVGHVMGLKTIAEFVENQAVFDKLKDIDIDYAQGYWNGKPVPWALNNAD